ncbi:hypothetical protein FIV42_10460 [Persicimonas caeni]|uniref:Uncharacterized protein n=1 Tax=Persicimonas caeni TaxID=2292766 RepID=A0A4Y6PS29_PERCE|nr:hypothetical protein [Persicimonas caeni]QDG51142.1 hypothetical protein FIV42_10460 [Persicimonas caeni]QED32363.1 hypothetical protein FRD00_10455 [Persicimonas caeni]
MKRTIFAMLLVLLWASPAAADDFSEWSWVEANWSPCEGVGVHGSYRVTARAKLESAGDEVKISNLTVVVSITHAAGKVTATGKVAVRKDGETTQTVTLEKPWYPVIAPTHAGPMLTLPRVKSSESPSPDDAQVLTVPKGAKLEFTITAMADTSSGACVIGNSEHEVALDS